MSDWAIAGIKTFPSGEGVMKSAGPGKMAGVAVGVTGVGVFVAVAGIKVRVGKGVGAVRAEQAATTKINANPTHRQRNSFLVSVIVFDVEFVIQISR